MIAAIALQAAVGAYDRAMPGTMFPVFDIAEHCSAMVASSGAKIAHLGKTCDKRESEYRELAKQAWDGADQSSRASCEIHALSAVGSYEVLASCLNAEFALKVFLSDPKEGKH